MPDIAGLKLIVPTSVAGSGVSVSASGKVTFTAATTVSVNGCFTASYDNYLVVYVGKNSDTTEFLCRLRASGTDNTANSYVRQRIIADNTSVSGGRTTFTYWDASSTSSGSLYGGAHFFFYGPALAQPTAMRSVTVGTISSAYIYDTAATHSVSSAYDGMTFYASVGTVTGTLTIYGLSQ